MKLGVSMYSYYGAMAKGRARHSRDLSRQLREIGADGVESLRAAI